MDEVQDLIIIGSGPAGLTAAIYAARGNLNPLLISGQAAGGQLSLTTDVDDFPGFPEGIQGPELIRRIRNQAEKFGTKFISEDVIWVDFSKKPFLIKTQTQEFLTKSVIVATGASAKWLGLDSEQRLIGRGVSSCAVCDGPFFKDKKIAVVGGGDTAMREVQHLSKYAKEILLIHRREDFRAQFALVDLIKAKPNVKLMLNTVVEEVLGDNKVSGIKVKNIPTGEVGTIDLEGVFIAIGHKPNTDFLRNHLALDDQDYIIVKDETHSSIPGVLVAGDVSDFRYRQAVTAAGAGAKAALDAEEYLNSL